MSSTSNQPDFSEDPYLGMVIDGAIIERKLGQGGMGAVYQARHLALETYIAIKVLPPEFAIDAEKVERFYREARSASKLEHPNIVQIRNVGQQNNVHFISMSFVAGQSLQSHINKLQRIPLQETLWIMKHSMQGILFAHEHGIIHRDIKPDNIMITTSGEVKIVDFGLARPTESGNTISMAGQIFGTPHFMSPEQCGGDLLDQRSDIYSLGITFYYMISGKRPYDGGQALFILMQHANQKEPTKELDTGELKIPLELAKIVRKMMEKDRERRYQSLVEVLQALEPILKEHPPKPLYSVVTQSTPPRREPSSVNVVPTESSKALSGSITPSPNVYSQPTTSPSVISPAKGPVRKAQINAPTPLKSDYVSPTQPLTTPPSPKNMDKMSASQKGLVTQNFTHSFSNNTLSKTINNAPLGGSKVPPSPRPKATRPEPFQGIFKKLFGVGIALALLMFGSMWLQKKSREVSYQKQVKFTEEQFAQLKQEKPIDFDAIRQLFVQLQQQYPESQSWCESQTKNLEQEEKEYRQGTLQEEEQTLRKKTPIEFTKIRELYYHYGQKYNTEMTRCQERIRELYREELELLFQENRLVEVSALLANPVWKRYEKEYYVQSLTRLNQACNNLYGDEERFLKTIPTQEVELLKLYQNILLLEEPEKLSSASYVLSTRSESLLKKILTPTETTQLILFLDCFSVAIQIRSDHLRPLLIPIWKENFVNLFFSLIQEKANQYALEELNKIFEELLKFRENSNAGMYFKMLEEALVYHILKLPFDENARLKENLGNTLFVKTFLRGWESFSMERVISNLPIPDKFPDPNPSTDSTEDPKPKRGTAYKQTGEALLLAIDDFRQKFEEIAKDFQPPLPPFMGDGKPPKKNGTSKGSGRPPHEDPEVQARLNQVKELMKKFVMEGDLSDSEFLLLRSEIKMKLSTLPPPMNILSNALPEPSEGRK